MPYNEKLAERVREALVDVPKVEEKKMFGALAFMVNGKMCITVGKDRIMCRIDPVIHGETIKRKGVQTVKMAGRQYQGYVHINEDALKAKKNFDYWVGLALDFNRLAKASKGK